MGHSLHPIGPFAQGRQYPTITPRGGRENETRDESEANTVVSRLSFQLGKWARI